MRAPEWATDDVASGLLNPMRDVLPNDGIVGIPVERVRPGHLAARTEGGDSLNRFLVDCLLTVAMFAILSQSQAHAEPIVAGVTNFSIAAIQDVELLPGTPFNPSNSAITITDLTAIGSFSINRAAQVGSTINYSGIDAYFTAASSPIGPFELGAGPTIGIGGFSGSIANVVQNPLDPGFSTGQPSSFASGDFLADVSQFGLRVGGQLLFTKDAVTFTGPLRRPTSLSGYHAREPRSASPSTGPTRPTALISWWATASIVACPRSPNHRA